MQSKKINRSRGFQRVVGIAASLALGGVALATPVSQDAPRDPNRGNTRDNSRDNTRDNRNVNPGGTYETTREGQSNVRNGGSPADLSNMRRVADAMRQNNITLDRVIAAAESHTKGTAVEARSRLDRDMPVVDVSVVDASGQMSTVCLDARNARVLEVFGGSANNTTDNLGNERDAAAAAAIVKGTEVVGKNIVLSDGEKVGEIHDLALDTTNQRIAYAIIELDEVNDNYFAVPWSAIRCDGEHAMIEGIDRQRMRGAPSFARSSWPRSWNDTQFNQSLATYYSREPYGTRDSSNSNATQWQAMKASDFFGRDVENRADENVGEIEDLAITPTNGRIAYAVLSVGGFLGFNDRLFAVPLEAFTHQSDGTCRLDVDNDRLKDAPGFDKKNWPRTGDATFDTQMREFYRDRSRDGATTPPTGNTRDTTRTPTRQ